MSDSPSYLIPDELKEASIQVHKSLMYVSMIQSSMERLPPDIALKELEKATHDWTEKQDIFYKAIREKYPELMTAQLKHEIGSEVITILDMEG